MPDLSIPRTPEAVSRGADGSRREGTWRGIADTAWAHRWLVLVVPTLLTALNVTLGSGFDARGLVYFWVSAAGITVCIVGTLIVFFAFAGGWVSSMSRGSQARSIGVHVLVACAAAAVGGELGLRLLRALALAPAPAHIRGEILGPAVVLGLLVMTALFVFGSLRDRARELELRDEQLRREAIRARFQALQARTEPHFLFNALNSVAGLIEEDPELAEKAVERLAELLRYSLDGSRRTTVPLSRELTAVRHFLELETLRYGDRLRTKVEVEPGLDDVPVPPLSLQPLVENAVLHGVAHRREGGTVAVRATRQDDELLLAVEDDGPGLGSSSHTGTGTALEDLRNRLHLLYGERGSLELAPSPSGCHVRLLIPLAGEEALP